MKKFTLLLVLLFSCMLKVSAQEFTAPIDYSKYTIVDFDAEYGKCSGKELANNFMKAINNSSKNTILVFNSAEYDFKNNQLSIKKPIIISGRIPAAHNLDVVGSSDISTTFKNPGKFLVNSSSVKFANLYVMTEKKADYGLFILATKENRLYDIVFFNMHIEGWYTQINGNEGAEVTIQNVWSEGFRRACYICDRRERVDVMPKCKFLNSKFICKESYYDYRAISFDSGNTEYPVVWDLSGTTIQNCEFFRGGIGFSKACNAKILGNTFEGDNIYMDMIHLEEFTHDMLIKGNRFVHLKPARGMYIDRERQSAYNITITDNKFEGNIGWVISSYSPINLTFENNDFTKAKINPKSKHITFDFSYYHMPEEREAVSYEIPTKGLVFRNNKGLENATMRLYAVKGDKSNIIELDKVDCTYIEEVQPELADGKYYIQNLEGEYISYNSKGEAIVTKKKNKKCVWDVKFEGLQNYSIKSKGNDYLESYQIFTLGHIRSGKNPVSTRLTANNNYKGKPRVPSFHLENYKDGYVLYPAGNERKSRVAAKGENLEIEIRFTHKEKEPNKRYLTPISDKATWKFIPAK